MLKFEEFSASNKARSEATFAKLTDLPPEWWSNAMAGECGEACNITKKLSRLARGAGERWNKQPDRDALFLREKLKREIGDVAIYADLLAQREGMTLEECVRAAFNEKSEEIGSDVKL